MGPYRELFVDAGDAMEGERLIRAFERRWDVVIADLYPAVRDIALDYARLSLDPPAEFLCTMWEAA